MDCCVLGEPRGAPLGKIPIGLKPPNFGIDFYMLCHQYWWIPFANVFHLYRKVKVGMVDDVDLFFFNWKKLVQLQQKQQQILLLPCRSLQKTLQVYYVDLSIDVLKPIQHCWRQLSHFSIGKSKIQNKSWLTNSFFPSDSPYSPDVFFEVNHFRSNLWSYRW